MIHMEYCYDDEQSYNDICGTPLLAVTTLNIKNATLMNNNDTWLHMVSRTILMKNNDISHDMVSRRALMKNDTQLYMVSHPVIM